MRATSDFRYAGNPSVDGLKPGFGRTTRDKIKNNPRLANQPAGQRNQRFANTLVVKPAWRRLSQLNRRTCQPSRLLQNKWRSQIVRRTHVSYDYCSNIAQAV